MKAPCTLLSLDDVMKKSGYQKSPNYLFVIGKEVVADTANVRIDSRIIEEIKVYKKADFTYLPALLASDILIFNIKLAADVPKPGVINVR